MKMTLILTLAILLTWTAALTNYTIKGHRMNMNLQQEMNTIRKVQATHTANLVHLQNQQDDFSYYEPQALVAGGR